MIYSPTRTHSAIAAACIVLLLSGTYLPFFGSAATTTGFYPDLGILKSVSASGPDHILGTADDSTTTASPGDILRYTATYGNTWPGDSAAGLITENIPAGTCLKPSSLSGMLAGSAIAYSNNGGSTYTHIPVLDADSADCSITHWRIALPQLAAPGKGEEWNGMVGVRQATTLTGVTGRPGIELISYPFEGEHSSSSNSIVEVVDIDNNGKKEIVIGSNNLQPTQIWAWQVVNTSGDYGYKKKYSIPLPTNIQWVRDIVSMDLNGDGRSETIVTYHTSVSPETILYIYEWNGTALVGTPISEITTPVWDGPVSILTTDTTDMDNDGKKEIYLTRYGNLYQVEYNTIGSYTAVDIPLTLWNSKTGIAVGDVDGDGTKEVVISGRQVYPVDTAKIEIMKYIWWVWTWTILDTGMTYSGWLYHRSITVGIGDGDNNGKNNIYVSNPIGTSSSTSFLSYEWNGSAYVPTPIGTASCYEYNTVQNGHNNIRWISIADYDNDGSNEVYNYSCQQIWKYNGTNYVSKLTSFQPSDFVFMDFDGNGSKEFVTPQGIFSWDGISPTITTFEPTNPTGGQTLSIGDTNGDGVKNIVVSNTTADVWVYQKTGAGDWVNFPLSGSDGATTTIDVADHDGDGSLDVVYFNNTNMWQSNILWKYNGSTLVSSIYTGGIMGAPAHRYITDNDIGGMWQNVFDADGDGSMENIISTPLPDYQYKINTPTNHTLWYGSGAGGLTLSSYGFALYNAGDLNGVIWDELLYFSSYAYSDRHDVYTWSGSTYSIYGTLKYTNGTNFAAGQHNGYSPAAAISVVDVTGDGKKDIIYNHTAFNPTMVYVNNPAVPDKFTQYILTGSIGVWAETHTLDLNTDGIKDIFIGKYAAESSVWTWNGSGFSSKFLVGSTMKNVDVQYADLNGNGKPEIYIAGNGDMERVYEWDGTNYSKLMDLKNPPAKIFFLTTEQYYTQNFQKPTSGFVQWTKLIVDEGRYGQPGETTIRYTLAPRNTATNTCGTPVVSAVQATLRADGLYDVDLSALNIPTNLAVMDWCFTADMKTINTTLSPRLFGWKSMYQATQIDPIVFDVVIPYTSTATTISNTIGIAEPQERVGTTGNPWIDNNTSTTASILITPDTTPPSVSISYSGVSVATGVTSYAGISPAILTNIPSFPLIGTSTGLAIVVSPVDSRTTASLTTTHADGTSVTVVCTISATGLVVCPPAALAEGLNTLVLTIKDGNGNPTIITQQVLLDTIVGIPTVDPIWSNYLTNDTTPSISGRGEPGSIVEIYDSGTLVGTGLVLPDGTYTTTLSTALVPDGVHTLSVRQIDPATNISAYTTVDYRIDTTVLMPIVSSPVSGFYNNDSTPTITGTGEVGSTVTIRDAAGIVVGTGTVQPDGTWNITTSPLPEGMQVFSVNQTDPAGNTTSPNALFPMTIDTIAPVAPTVTSSGSTNDQTPTITGTGEVGSTITIRDENGIVVGTSIVGTDGKWTITTSTLAPGVHPLSVVSTDAAKNDSPITTFPLYIDLTNPQIIIIDPGVTAVGTPTHVPSTGPVGITDPTATMTMTVANASGTTTVVCSVSPTGAFNCPVPTLAVGQNVITLTSTDPAGNVTKDTYTVTVPAGTATPANTPPSLIITSPAAGTTVSTGGISAPAGITDPGTVITISTTNASGTTTPVVCTVTLAGTFVCPTPVLVTGPNTISIVATNPTTGVSTTETRSVFVDPIANIPLLVVTQPVSGLSNSGGTVPAGTTVSGATVDMTVSNASGTTIVACSVSPSGVFVCPPVVYTQGTNVVSITTKDQNGNMNTVTNTILVDTTPPVLTTNIDASPYIYVPTLSGSVYTPYDSMPLVGRTDPGSVVYISLNGVQIPAIISPTGDISAVFTPLNIWDNKVVIKITDRYGNITEKTYTIIRPGASGGGGNTWGGAGTSGWSGTPFVSPFSTVSPATTPTATPAVSPTSPVSTIGAGLNSASTTGAVSTGTYASGSLLFPQFTRQCTSEIKDLNDPRLLAYYSPLGVVDSTNPNRRMTRAEFLKLLLRAAKVDTTQISPSTKYTDVDISMWYAPLVAYATTYGIVNGQDGMFRPDDTISRAEVAKILVRSANIWLSTDISTFSDISDMWDLQQYIQTAYDSCILHGRQTANTGVSELAGGIRVYEPKDGITLAETTKVLYNMTQR